MDDRERYRTVKLLDEVLSDAGEREASQGWVVALAGAGMPRFWSTDMVSSCFRSLGRTTLWFPTERDAAVAAGAKLGHLAAGVSVHKLTDAELQRACRTSPH